MNPTPLIPRDVLFGNPDRAMARLNPGGTHIAFLAPRDGVLNVWVAPATDPAAAQPVTHDTGRGIRSYTWAYTNRHIVYSQDMGGDENWQIHVVDLETGGSRNLTPQLGVHATISGVSLKHPETIIVGLNDRVPQLHDLWRFNITTGEKTLLLENPGFAGFVCDDTYAVRFGLQMREDGGMDALQHADGTWKPYLSIGMEDTMGTGFAGFDKSLRRAYFTDSRNRDTAALFQLDLESGEQTLIAEDARADVSDWLVHPTEKTVEAVAFEYDRKVWQFHSPEVERDFAVLRKADSGDIEVASRTVADDQWLVAYVKDDGPVHYYHFDRAAQRPTFLFTTNSRLEGLPLVPMHPVVIPARDGLELISYLTLPPGSDSDGDGVPDAPLSMVLQVHGGPWVRDDWGYNATHQWLANRGHAVLSVNYRGSTGFGKGYANAAIKEWGRKMHDDLIDAVEWAVLRGIADRDRVAIMGGSYGGYATLVGLTFTPERFACGVDIVGPSNLVTLLESVPPYWEPAMAMWTNRVGDHRTDEGRALLTERSPLTHVDRICRPLLIAQGANDPRVKQAESDQIVKAMQDKGIPVTYVLYPDEGHGFARPENRLSFYAIAEAFLAQHLGGRYEPIGDGFTNSSVTVPEGAAMVPGLPEAIGNTTV